MAKIYPEISTDFHNSLGEFKIFEALKKCQMNGIYTIQ